MPVNEQAFLSGLSCVTGLPYCCSLGLTAEMIWFSLFTNSRPGFGWGFLCCRSLGIAVNIIVCLEIRPGVRRGLLSHASANAYLTSVFSRIPIRRNNWGTPLWVRTPSPDGRSRNPMYRSGGNRLHCRSPLSAAPLSASITWEHIPPETGLLLPSVCRSWRLALTRSPEAAV